MTTISGYEYETVTTSPVTPEELQLLKASVLFGPADEAALRQAGEVLANQIEDVLDVWYGFIGSHHHLRAQFSGPDGEPVSRYLDAVRGRFGQWIWDTCERPWDEQWLAYQNEIGLRHTPYKKNRTDRVESTTHVPLRYLIALIYPITATVRPFLEKSGRTADEVDAMQESWRKAVILQVALWTRPYAPGPW
ncbi:protoglobin [Georgenia soli]|uniref:Protoglobin n=1 Tax=Georgenia soli TaxID=638953 RepID=A0A2A9EJP4_9MICO|nr:protoglobin domain-containing protein [Georgenia soli]PFG39297.1 protoglobin [Georgenia soli]